MPEDIDNLYRGYRKVPKVYVQEEEFANIGESDILYAWDYEV